MAIDEKQFMGATVIPDEIEPRIGFKYLYVIHGGRLYSPFNNFPWKPMEKAVAEGCSRLVWEPHRNPPPRSVFDQGMPLDYSSTTVGVFTAGPTVPQQPLTLLPPGMQWFCVSRQHEAPLEDCSCGIYAVDSPSLCEGYYSHGSVLVELAMWGKVIPGTTGMRCQYAYPNAIYGQRENMHLARSVAETYGVPLVSLDKESNRPELRPVKVPGAPSLALELLSRAMVVGGPAISAPIMLVGAIIGSPVVVLLSLPFALIAVIGKLLR